MIELKHVAPYLPYKLKGFFILSDVINLSPSQKDEKRESTLTKDNVPFFLIHCKPILKPLSDIYYNVTGGKVMNDLDCDLKTVHELWDLYNKDKAFELNDLSYKTYEIALQNHFDVFGLIKKGLAIDINDLK